MIRNIYVLRLVLVLSVSSFELAVVFNMEAATKLALTYKDLLSVKYDSCLVQTGMELTPTQVQAQPNLWWDADDGSYYTLILTDPDVTSFTQYVHWLVVNIPSNNVSAGNTLFDYIGSAPRQGQGLHRYVFLLFKQPGKLHPTVTEHIQDIKIIERGQFSIPFFIKQNCLEGPVAGNFFRAQYDDSVPKSYAKLKEKYEM